MEQGDGTAVFLPSGQSDYNSDLFYLLRSLTKIVKTQETVNAKLGRNPNQIL